MLEAAAETAPSSFLSCAVCNLFGLPGNRWVVCSAVCTTSICSPACQRKHHASCSVAPPAAVDIFSDHLFDSLSWSLAELNLKCSGSVSSPLASVALFVPAGRPLVNSPGKALRSARRPLGEHGSLEAHTRMRKDNKEVFRLIDLAARYLSTDRKVIWVADAADFSWAFPAIVSLAACDSICSASVHFFLGQRNNKFRVLHNVPALQVALDNAETFVSPSPHGVWPHAFFIFCARRLVVPCSFV